MEVGQLWVKLGLDKSGFNSGVNEAKGQSTGLGGFIKNAFQFTVGQGMFDLLKTGIKSAWDTSIGFNSEMEQSQAAFSTLLGSADKAKNMLSSLSNMAASTPFELNDLNKASQTLLGFGIDSKNVMSDLKMLGDVSMGNKEKLQGLALVFAQVQSQGKLMGQDLLQMINNGFNPLTIISKQTGKSMAVLKDEMAKGGISADMVTKAFQAATSQGGLFYGAMDKQSKTFEGQMSTLKDNIRMTFGGMLKSGFDYLSQNALPVAINSVGRFQEVFTKTGNVFLAFREMIKTAFGSDISTNILAITDKITGLGLAIKGFITGDESSVWDGLTDWMGLSLNMSNTLTNGIMALRNGIIGTFGWIEQHGPLVKTIIAGIASGYIAYKTAVMASIATTEIHNALEAISAIRAGKSAVMLELETGMKGSSTIAQRLLNAAMEANPIGIVIALIVALVGVLVYLWNTNKGFREFILGMWGGIKDTVGGAINAVKGFFSGLGDHIKNTWNGIKENGNKALTAIKADYEKHGGGIKGILLTTWDSYWKVYETGYKVLNKLTGGKLEEGRKLVQSGLNSIKDFFVNGWNNIKSSVTNIITSLWYGVNNKFQDQIELIKDIILRIKEVFTTIFDAIKTYVLGVVLLLCDLLTGNFTKFKEDARKIFSKLKVDFNIIWDDIKGIFVNTILVIVGVSRKLFEDFIAGLQLIWEGFKNFLIGLWESIKTNAIGAWNSLKSSATNTATNTVSSAKDIWNGLLAWFEALPGRLYNAGSSMFNGLKNGAWSVLSGLGGLIESGFNSTISFITSLPGRAYGWGTDFIQGLINGIKNMINKVKDAAGGVGNAIRAILHFSVPDEGPLRDYETWMPDFIKGMVKGIDGNKSTLIDKIKNLASNMALNVKGNLTNTAMAGVAQGNSTSTINLYGNYGFKDKDDMTYFLNQMALIVKGKR